MTADETGRAKAVKRAHESQWLAIDGVVGVGVGVTSSGRIGIIVSVKDRPASVRARIPTAIGDTEIDVRVTGEIRAL